MAKINKTDKEWKEQLTEEQYRIARKSATEQPFTGDYYNTKETGKYRCICCGEELFDSDKKFDSGSGWPSFWMPVNKDCIKEIVDNSHGMRRVEVRCESCDAHLGHVFEDGPEPTGLRYCINSAVITFEKS
ncbi:MAG: peptide-methionine (R)-S-oxide reductase MsrB [Gammaproteobacteria bacterium]|nr:peptide-methionine (R)-S-oxide reductase MsrB [Gammaproteobacteria bacterium]